jgi:excinuclease ABC subunit A
MNQLSNHLFEFCSMATQKNIRVEGARMHNLKNITVEIPRRSLTVITGLSGSGKSSLAFDTLFAEGQRRYVESLSAYARQFLGRLDKPDVDRITGISPAIAIEQKVTSKSSRSTVGTSTEIYDYLKLLYARVGKTFSPISGKEVKRHTTSDVKQLMSKHNGGKFLILVDLSEKNWSVDLLIQKGFSRIWVKDELQKLEDLPSSQSLDSGYLIIDRLAMDSENEDEMNRLSDSLESAFKEGSGEMSLYHADAKKYYTFSNKFELDGMTFEIPSLHFFSFNNPIGACKKCGGFGSIIGVDENLVIPDKRLSVYQDAVQCWKGNVMSEWKDQLVLSAKKSNFPIHKAYKDLTKEERDMLWNGTPHFHGIYDFFQFLEKEAYKIQYRVMLSRYRGKTTCPDCQGTRLRKDATYVKIHGMDLSTMVQMPIKELTQFFHEVKWTKPELEIGKRIFQEITQRLQFLMDVGLEYITLNRLSSTLSGGESQRIHLATNLGSSLVGSIYILDEPSIGLHPKDTEKLIGVLKQLKEQGNTVIVVEHDEKIMLEADHLIDMGPEAGSLGGQVVFSGPGKKLLQHKESLTAQYLNKFRKIERKSPSIIGKDFITLEGAHEHNLQHVDIQIPLHALTAIAGVSGSGKSTLIKNILYPALSQHVGEPISGSNKYTQLGGALKKIKHVIFVDQNPIGRSSRSNPITYLKAYDEIREIFASQPGSTQRGLTPTHFSFNVDGGRCESCQGEGVQTVSMQFMADVQLVCESCKGKRFKDEVIEVEYKGKSISDVLEMTVDEAVVFFEHPTSRIHKNLITKLRPLQHVGMGYVSLGQSSSTLSGGEAQRIKLASFLSKKNQEHTLFLFDEPSTGLHAHDVSKLMSSFEALLNEGHTILTIEHHTDIIACADWLIELGPEGGNKGGQLIFQGPLKECKKKGSKSVTAQYLNL